MTDFLASYIFLTIGGIGLICGLVFKRAFLFWAACIAWAISGIYFYIEGDTETWVYALGTFCILMAILCVGAAMQTISSNKPKPTTIVKKTYVERLDDLRAKRGGNFKR